MNALINRFITKNTSSPTLEIVGEDKRFELLNWLVDLGSSSPRLQQLKQNLSNYIFPNEGFLADLHAVKMFLELEEYLIFHDPRYINTKEKLRFEINEKFSETTQSLTFLPLYESNKNQEILLSHCYLKYVVKTFKREPKSSQLATRWLDVLNYKSAPKTSPSLVHQVNTLRKLKESSNEVYNEFVESFGKKWVDSILSDCQANFSAFYFNLKSVSCLKDILPINQNINEIETELIPPKLNTQGQFNEETKSNEISKKAILENILDAFVLFNRKGEILEYNTNAVQVLGLQINKTQRESLLDILPTELSETLKSDLDNLHPTTPYKIVGTRGETEIVSYDNIGNDYEFTITSNYTEEDTFSLFLKNITNKKDTLKSIKEAQKNAEDIAKAKSTFLSNMSHEIRTPLNVILGLSEIISKNEHIDDSLLFKNIEGIDFSARNLLSIVNDILDFSKIEAGKLSIQNIDFNLHKVVNSLASGFEIKAHEKGIHLSANIHSDIPNIVIGDQYRLNQILTNLLGNAVKFTLKGHVALEVSKVSESENEINLKFQVKDTGVGIPKNQIESIYDSFYQVESPESSKIVGTGLGLAITKELISLHNGNLQVSSIVGKGSIFEFTIPLKKSKLKTINQTINSQVRNDDKLKGLKVLVAEDNKMNQFYIKQLLSGMDVEVDIAENGKTAVETFQNSTTDYDLILMDMHMPIMDGLEAISIIRKSNKNSIKKVPIVACSADVFPEARKNAIKAGIDFYLTKPLNEEAVKEVLFWLVSDTDIDSESQKPQISSPLLSKETIGNSGTVDLNMLRETFDNDDEFIISLLDVFIKETPEDYKSMRTCVDREFYIRAGSLAHKMKSSFMNLGMTLHGHHLQQIETKIIKAEGLEEAKKHLSLFYSLYTKALLEVNILLIELRQH